MRLLESEVWKQARHICSILYENGKQCYAVGGAVRDLVLGKEPHDIDLATDALPEEVKEIMEKAGCRTYPTGERFGTITVTCDGKHYYEITTFRGEKYIRGSRKPIVTFSKNLMDDLKRRDFTFNAMAYDFLSGEIIDPFGGLEDLEKGTIRAVGDSEERFKEDPLRIFRMCRFASILGFDIDEKTMEAAKKVSHELEWVSMERKTEEMKKALTKSKKPSIFISCLVESGAMRYYIPEIYETIGVSQPPPHGEDVYEHILETLDNTPNDYTLRMSALLHDIAKPRVKRETKPFFPRHEKVGAEMARDIMRRTKHSRKEVEEVAKLVENHMHLWHTKIENDLEARRTILRLAKRGVRDQLLEKLLDLFMADAKATKKLPPEELMKVKRKIELINRWKYIPTSRKQLAVDGYDLMAIGIKPVYLGLIFDILLEYVAEDPSRNTKEQLLKKAKTFAKSIGALAKNTPLFISQL